MNSHRTAIANRPQGCASLVSELIQLLTDTEAGASLAAFGLVAKELNQFLFIKSDATLWKWIKQRKISHPSYLNFCRVWRLSEFNCSVDSWLSADAPSTPMSNQESVDE